MIRKVSLLFVSQLQPPTHPSSNQASWAVSSFWPFRLWAISSRNAPWRRLQTCLERHSRSPSWSRPAGNTGRPPRTPWAPLNLPDRSRCRPGPGRRRSSSRGSSRGRSFHSGPGWSRERTLAGATPELPRPMTSGPTQWSSTSCRQQEPRHHRADRPGWRNCQNLRNEQN